MLLIDAHVHVYDCFDFCKFFDFAYANFKSAAENLGHADDFTGILLLAETSKDDWFYHLCEYAGGKDLPDGKKAGEWQFYHTDENCSLTAKSDDLKKIVVIAGRQVVTAEGLEVLAIGTEKSFQDFLPIKVLIETVKEKSGIAVIPWGFGKWMGRRGDILKELIEAAQNGDFSLGDNGGRPSLMPTPYHFNLAKKKRIRNLPGTDPLPFRSEQKRVGSFGLSCRAKINPNYPAQSTKNAITDNNCTTYSYGSLERNIYFISKQIRMQFKKRTR